MADTIKANGVKIAYRFDGPENGPVVVTGRRCYTWRELR